MKGTKIACTGLLLCFSLLSAAAFCAESFEPASFQQAAPESSQLSGAVSHSENLQQFLEPYFEREVRKKTGLSGPFRMQFAPVLKDQQQNRVLNARLNLAGGGEISLRAKVASDSYKLLELSSEYFRPVSLAAAKADKTAKSPIEQKGIKDLKLGAPLRGINWQLPEPADEMQYPELAGQTSGGDEAKSSIPEAPVAQNSSSGQPPSQTAGQPPSNLAVSPANENLSPEAAGRMINAIRYYNYLRNGAPPASMGCP